MGSSAMRLGRHQPAKPHQLALLVCAYLIARLDLLKHWDSPVFGWRPADIASISLSYYRNGFHFIYPQVFWGGNGPGYVEMEFPIVPYWTGMLLELLGVHQYVFVILPLLFGWGLVWLTYRFGSYFFDAGAGIAGALVVAVVPILTMLTIQGGYADPPMVFFATLGLYLFVRWADDGHWARLACGITCVALAALIKLTGLYIGVPILYLMWRKDGASTWRSAVLWLTGAGVLIPVVLWYWHAHRLFVEYHNTFGILGAGYLKFGTASILTSAAFYLRTAYRFGLYHLTPFGSLGFLVGLELSRRRRLTFVFVWLLSVALYVLVAAGGIAIGHFHYLMPLLPVCAMVAGAGLQEIFLRLLAFAGHGGRVLAGVALCVLLLAFAANTAYASNAFVTRDRGGDWPRWQQKKATGERLARLARPNALILVVDDDMDAWPPEKSMTPPEVFYFADRRGWYLSLAWLDQQKLEQRRRDGAQYFVVSAQSSANFRSKRPDLLAYLQHNYRTILDDGDGLAFDLTERPSALSN